MDDQEPTKTQMAAEIDQLRKQVEEQEVMELNYRRTEIELQETNAFLRNILESSLSISIISTDLDHNVLYWNKGAERIFGYKSQEIVGKHKIDIIYPEGQSQQVLQNIRSSLIENKESISCEIQEVNKDKQLLWISMNLTPRLNEKGKVIGFLGIGEDITQRKKVEEELKKNMETMKKSLRGVIHTMEQAIESRDPYTAGHQRRVANLAVAIGTEMGLTPDQLDGMHLAGIIHDLGKISVPAEILSKPGTLSGIQYDMIKTHSQVGYDILKNIEFPWPIAEIMIQHHEKIDGSGYPLGLMGDEILLEARILAVADVVEAMASHRPYRASLGLDKALEEISEKSGLQYDSQAVDTCLRLFREKGYEMEETMYLAVPAD